MDFPSETQQQFRAVSSALTGFADIDLMAAGMGEAYWNELVSIAGITIAGEFLSACGEVFARSRDERSLEHNLRTHIMDDPKFGPLARNVIVLWYMGQWNALPPSWADAYGGSVDDVTHVLSPQAYREGLVWPAFGSHPRAAKATGFGSWAEPPLIPINTDYYHS